MRRSKEEDIVRGWSWRKWRTEMRMLWNVSRLELSSYCVVSVRADPEDLGGPGVL